MSDYQYNVFINCPFDKKYNNLFNGIVFAVHDCGFISRCALEIDDASQTRIEKIFQIISDCKFSIHDLSRTELDPLTKLPRFNMPLELGIFLGAKYFGRGKQRDKLCLIMDRDKYRYRKFCSDISGQDITAHNGNVEGAIKITRDWLQTALQKSNIIIPSGSAIYDRYLIFKNDLPDMCEELNLNEHELIFWDFINLVYAWLNVNAW